jgi:hypothetical protein
VVELRRSLFPLCDLDDCRSGSSFDGRWRLYGHVTRFLA